MTGRSKIQHKVVPNWKYEKQNTTNLLCMRLQMDSLRVLGLSSWGTGGHMVRLFP